MRMTIADAAKIALEVYSPEATHLAGRRIEAIQRGDAAAVMLKGDILVIRGSDSSADYHKFNLKVLRLGQRKMKLASNELGTGQSGTIWHQGFLEHARQVQNFITKTRRRPSMIIGHSLGAATTQILSLGYGVPGIGFAPPRTCMSKVSPAQEKRCLLIVRSDDIVTQVPAGFFHLGRVCMLNIVRPIGHKHAMTSYMEVLPAYTKAGLIPVSWGN